MLRRHLSGELVGLAERQDDREVWRASRRAGDPVATFGPGEFIRCPGKLQIPGYVGPCGAMFDGERCKPGTRVILQVRFPRVDYPGIGTVLKCRTCGTHLEKSVLVESS